MKWHGGKGSTRRPGKNYSTGWDLIWNKKCMFYFNGATYPNKCHKSKCMFWNNGGCKWEQD